MRGQWRSVPCTWTVIFVFVVLESLRVHLTIDITDKLLLLYNHDDITDSEVEYCSYETKSTLTPSYTKCAKQWMNERTKVHRTTESSHRLDSNTFAALASHAYGYIFRMENTDQIGAGTAFSGEDLTKIV
ncbi:hypothetical protein V8B97DRAFT_1296799 [Scleroderma yunnanense]